MWARASGGLQDGVLGGESLSTVLDGDGDGDAGLRVLDAAAVELAEDVPRHVEVHPRAALLVRHVHRPHWATAVVYSSSKLS